MDPVIMTKDNTIAVVKDGRLTIELTVGEDVYVESVAVRDNIDESVIDCAFWLTDSVMEERDIIVRYSVASVIRMIEYK